LPDPGGADLRACGGLPCRRAQPSLHRVADFPL